VARTRKTENPDAISRLADAGEDALRRLVDLPRRTVVGAMDRVAERLDDVTTKLRSVDPLARRVTALEERLDSLEKPKKTTARTASPRAKRSAARGASTAAAPIGAEQVHDRSHGGDTRAEGEREQAEARAQDEGEHAQ
jgi:hypothetical protein